MELITIIGANVQLDVNWLLGIIGVLGASVGSIAGVLWAFMLSRLKKQDEIIENQGAVIESQGETIKHLEQDVQRLSKGCGLTGCVRKDR